MIQSKLCSRVPFNKGFWFSTPLKPTFFDGACCIPKSQMSGVLNFKKINTIHQKPESGSLFHRRPIQGYKTTKFDYPGNSNPIKSHSYLTTSWLPVKGL